MRRSSAITSPQTDRQTKPRAIAITMKLITSCRRTQKICRPATKAERTESMFQPVFVTIA